MAGRPTTYNKKIVGEQVTAYMDDCRAQKKLPTIEGLAVFLNTARSTLYKWAEEHDEFSDMLEDLMAEQGDTLIQKGLIGTFNPTITKLILTKHNYADRQELTGANGESLFDAEAKTKGKEAVGNFLNRRNSGKRQ